MNEELVFTTTLDERVTTLRAWCREVAPRSWWLVLAALWFMGLLGVHPIAIECGDRALWMKGVPE